MGCFTTALLGIGGSIIGSLIGSALLPAGGEGFTHPNRLLHFVFAIIGAVFLLWLWRAIIARNR
jgi:uncharacterized membrane protein YeaQ/YmgE (transglycosylase-associated protein family)